MRGSIAIGPAIVSGTALTETSLTGAGVPWQVPKGTKKIEGVWVSYCVAGVATVAVPHYPKLRIYSADLKIEPCDILVEGGPSIATPSGGSYSGELAEAFHFYPLNIQCNGGEQIFFYGSLFAAAAAPGWMGASVQFNDTGADYLWAPPGRYFYRANSAMTATTAVTLTTFNETTTYRISGAKKITGLYGLIGQTTSVPAIGINGKFTFASTDLKVPFSPSMVNVPADSNLASGEVATHLSYVEDLDIPCADQTTIQGSWMNGAGNTIGLFITGVQYQ